MENNENTKRLEERLNEENSEKNRNMSFGSVFKSMLPSVVVGTLTAAGCQEACSEYTSNPEMITLSGMVGQYVGGWSAYLPLHFYNNRDRLRDEEGRVKWKQYMQDMGAVVASDQVGNKFWAFSYGVANEIVLRAGINPATAGLISGATSGVTYSAFTAWAAPKVNGFIDYVKEKVKGRKKSKCHQADLAKMQ